MKLTCAIRESDITGLDKDMTSDSDLDIDNNMEFKPTQFLVSLSLHCLFKFIYMDHLKELNTK